MSNPQEIIRIRSDDCLFIVMIKTINKFPQSLFFKILNNMEQSDFIFRDNNTLYVDIKPENIKIIVDHMRGYKINSFNDSIILDFERLYLNLPEEFEKYNSELSTLPIINQYSQDDDPDNNQDNNQNNNQDINQDNNQDKENLFVKLTKSDDNIASNSHDNFAKSFFEKLTMPKDHNDSITSMSELNNAFTEMTDSWYKTNNNFRIIRPRKEKLDTQT